MSQKVFSAVSNMDVYSGSLLNHAPQLYHPMLYIVRTFVYVFGGYTYIYIVIVVNNNIQCFE